MHLLLLLLLFKAERCKQEQVRQEIAEASFHPEITRLAQKMWGPHQNGSAPAWQRLSKGKGGMNSNPGACEVASGDV